MLGFSYDIRIAWQKEEMDMKKANLLKRVLSIVLVGVLAVGSMPSAKVQAADVDKKAGKVFAKALNVGKITFNDDSQYCLCDINCDGVKELIIREDFSHYVIWEYSKGKVSKLVDFYAEYVLSYNKKTNTFWETGDGDGSWAVGHKLKDNKLKKTGIRYDYSNFNNIAEKTVNGKTKRISVKRYDQIRKKISKNNAMKMKHISKSKLIKKLQNKENKYTQVTNNNVVYYKAWYADQKDIDKTGVVRKITLKENKIITTGSFRKASKESELYTEKATYCNSKKRTFKLESNVKFYSVGGDNPKRRLSESEYTSLCKEENGLGVILKVKNGKVVSVSFCS